MIKYIVIFTGHLSLSGNVLNFTWNTKLLI
jgi:hypothetical protein